MERDFRVGNWLVRPDVNQLEREGKEESIEPKVMDVLVYLSNHAGEVLTKERLIQAVWPDTFVTDDALKYASVSLRKVLGDNVNEPRFIRTIPKRVCQLIADVRFPEEAAAKPDRYRIERKLGEGGVGEVWLARDAELNRRVALKFLRPEQETDEIGHRRLRREARAAAALDHPYICKVYDTGTLEGRSFIAMEYPGGEKLSEHLKLGPLPLTKALRIALEMSEALEDAHRPGRALSSNP